jgi:hypothetical protein
MIRLLRRVLRIGLLAGVGVGIVKVVKGRKAHDPWADSWVSTGTPGATRPSPAPVPAATPKPPAPSGAGSAALSTPPPASAKPPAPAESGQADLAVPPAASPAPATPETATGEASSDGESGSEDSGEPAPKGSTRSSRSSNTGPARKSPTGKAEEPPGERLWVAANDGVCPQSHPVKAKLSSKIFHTRESRNYSRTKADRCYPDEGSAQADGLRPAQR